MLTNLTFLPKISTLYNSTKMALNYINKGLFYSAKIGLLNRLLFIKYRAILVWLYGVYCFNNGGGCAGLL